MPASARMASNRPGNFPSRSLIRNRARQPAAAPGGVHGGGQRSERVAERGAGRAQPGVRVEPGELAGGVAAQRLSAGPQPPQPAPHGAGRHAEAGSDHPVPGALQCGTGGGSDDRDAVHAPRCAPARQQHLGPAAGPAPRPDGPEPGLRPAGQGDHPLARMPPRTQPSPPARAGQPAARQGSSRPGGIGAQQHRRSSSRSPGQAARPGRPRPRAAGVAACRHDGCRQARTPRSSRSDTMNTAGAGKQPATSLAAPVFTVSPHTQGPYARQALISRSPPASPDPAQVLKTNGG